MTSAWLAKKWAAINRLSVIWKSDLTDKMKHSLFQVAVVPIMLYRCTTWTLTKRMKKKLDGYYTRTLRAILNGSWMQHPIKQQLYGHLPPIMKTIKIRRTRHAENYWKNRVELTSDVLLWTPFHGQNDHLDDQQDDQLEPTYSSSVPIWDVALKAYRKRWTVEREGLGYPCW